MKNENYPSKIIELLLNPSLELESGISLNNFSIFFNFKIKLF